MPVKHQPGLYGIGHFRDVTSHDLRSAEVEILVFFVANVFLLLNSVFLIFSFWKYPRLLAKAALYF
jgi:hypothetical protein